MFSFLVWHSLVNLILNTWFRYLVKKEETIIKDLQQWVYYSSHTMISFKTKSRKFERVTEENITVIQGNWSPLYDSFWVQWKLVFSGIQEEWSAYQNYNRSPFFPIKYCITYFSIVPKSHLGSLLNGIFMPWNLAIFSAISAEMSGKLSSSVVSFLLCNKMQYSYNTVNWWITELWLIINTSIRLHAV